MEEEEKRREKEERRKLEEEKRRLEVELLQKQQQEDKRQALFKQAPKVAVWLDKLELENYLEDFVKNGFDTLSTVSLLEEKGKKGHL